MSAVVAKPVDYWTLNASGLTSVASSWSNAHESPHLESGLISASFRPPVG